MAKASSLNPDNVAEKIGFSVGTFKQTGKATEEVAQNDCVLAEVTSSQARETQESVTKLEELSKVIDELNESVRAMNAESEQRICQDQSGQHDHDGQCQQQALGG